MCNLQVDLRTSQLCQNGGMPGLCVVSLAVYAGRVGWADEGRGHVFMESGDFLDVLSSLSGVFKW